ncbi:MAG: hypothetical protein H0U76_22440 [Ktedonobacteraceae bacterium]|nr:hypothetical protein [Ktedonobacteraceae bacterium]
MSWEKELDQILSDLGVQQEYTPSEQTYSSIQEVNFFITHLSRSRPGVSYRLDLTDTVPELRVYMPTDDGTYKIRIYLVRLAPGNFLLHLFGLCMVYQGGSRAYQEIEGSIIYHALHMLLHAMVELFWQGNLVAFQFPPEIEVRSLL